MDIAHAPNGVGRGRGRADIEDQLSVPDDRDRLLQDRCGITEHIGASLERTLVTRANQTGVQERAADAGCKF